MSDFAKQLKAVVEIASIAVGLALGVLALWQQFKPRDEVIAEVLSTDTRFPVDFMEHLRSVPGRVQEALDQNEEIIKLIRDKSARAAVAAKTKELVNEKIQATKYLGYFAEEVFGNGLVAITIRNTGDKPARDLRLSRSMGPIGSYTIVRADGKVEGATSTTSAVELGDLPARSTIKLYFWGGITALFTMPDAFTIAHQDGVAEIRMPVAVPELMWRTDGIFLSYRYVTYFLLAILLMYYGIGALLRRRQSISV